MVASVDQAAVAPENARLLSETLQALHETEALYSATRRLAEANDVQEIVAAVTESAPESAINRAVLWSAELGVEDEVREFVAIANWYRGDGTCPLPVGTRFLADQFSLIDVTARKGVFFQDMRSVSDDRIGGVVRVVLEQQSVRSLGLLPVWGRSRLRDVHPVGDTRQRGGQRQLGVLMLMGEEPHAFSAQEMRLYESLVGQTAVSLERLEILAQLRDRLQSEQIRAQRESTIRDIVDRMQQATDMESLMRITTTELAKALGASRAYVRLGIHRPDALMGESEPTAQDESG